MQQPLQSHPSLARREHVISPPFCHDSHVEPWQFAEQREPSCGAIGTGWTGAAAAAGDSGNVQFDAWPAMLPLDPLCVENAVLQFVPLAMKATCPLRSRSGHQIQGGSHSDTASRLLSHQCPHRCLAIATHLFQHAPSKKTVRDVGLRQHLEWCFDAVHDAVSGREVNVIHLRERSAASTSVNRSDGTNISLVFEMTGRGTQMAWHSEVRQKATCGRAHIQVDNRIFIREKAERCCLKGRVCGHHGADGLDIRVVRWEKVPSFAAHRPNDVRRFRLRHPHFAGSAARQGATRRRSCSRRSW
jgi:hypothetical protein